MELFCSGSSLPLPERSNGFECDGDLDRGVLHDDEDG